MEQIVNEPDVQMEVAAPVELPPVVVEPLRSHDLVATSSAPKFQLTDQLCACGCGTQLSNISAARGWQYVRGHKQGAGAVHNSTMPTPRALPPGKATVTGMSQVQTFLRQNEQLVDKQIDECHERLKALENEKRTLEHRVAVLREQHKKYKVALEALGAA